MHPRRGPVTCISSQEAMWNNRWGAVHLIQPHTGHKNRFLFSALGFKMKFLLQKNNFVLFRFLFVQRGAQCAAGIGGPLHLAFAWWWCLIQVVALPHYAAQKHRRRVYSVKRQTSTVGLEYSNATVFSSDERSERRIFFLGSDES